MRPHLSATSPPFAAPLLALHPLSAKAPKLPLVGEAGSWFACCPIAEASLLLVVVVAAAAAGADCKCN